MIAIGVLDIDVAGSSRDRNTSMYVWRVDGVGEVQRIKIFVNTVWVGLAFLLIIFVIY
jgi:hypothetical protein